MLCFTYSTKVAGIKIRFIINYTKKNTPHDQNHNI